MITVLFAADFPIAKTGIVSTASSLLATVIFKDANLFSSKPLFINGVKTRNAFELGKNKVDLVFTHAEYSNLHKLQQQYPDAIYHVGDWPLRYWRSVRKIQPFKGLLGILRCYWRLRNIKYSMRIAFVTEDDWKGAKNYGFQRALYLPIGVNPPTIQIAERVDERCLCFTGNFRYEPNLMAAKDLLNFAKHHLSGYKVILAGFYANDFQDQVSSNVELHSDVPSVIDFLASRRPIYVSLIKTGAGAKNKILEAMSSGCPIICTAESLDSSIAISPSIKLLSSEYDTVSQLREILDSIEVLEKMIIESGSAAFEIHSNRSWKSVALKMHEQITSLSQ